MLTSPTIIRAAVRALRVVPVGAMRAVALFVGTVAFWGARARRLTILDNLTHIAPELGASGQRRLARRTFINLMDAAVDLYRLPTTSREELFQLVAIEGQANLDAALALGRGVIA
ncbi:MAG: hypothetical protein ABIT38_00235, partial [Gemmatimonadaceae bacterium]